MLVLCAVVLVLLLPSTSIYALYALFISAQSTGTEHRAQSTGTGAHSMSSDYKHYTLQQIHIECGVLKHPHRVLPQARLCALTRSKPNTTRTLSPHAHITHHTSPRDSLQGADHLPSHAPSPDLRQQRTRVCSVRPVRQRTPRGARLCGPRKRHATLVGTPARRKGAPRVSRVRSPQLETVRGTTHLVMS